MALKIYSAADPNAFFSVDGDMGNPIHFSFDGCVGGVLERKLYIRNDDALKTYSDVVITPIDFTGASIVDGTNGFSVKLKDGNTQPNSLEWANVSAGSSLSYAGEFPGVATYSPFWVRVEVPRGAATNSYDDVVFRIEADEQEIP